MGVNIPFSTAIIGSIVIAVLSWNIFRLLSTSLLNNIPGPWLARTTPYYIILIDAAGNRTQRIHKLHQQYGPVVRIGPNEVSFTAPSVVKELYSQGTPYMKAPWYSHMSVPPLGIFSLLDRKAHADRRRLLNHAFSQSALNDAEPTIATLITKMLNTVSKAADDPIDMLLLCRRLSLDIVGQLFLGQSFQALGTEEPPKFLEWMDNVFLGYGIKYAFPVIYQLIKILPLQGPREMISSPIRTHEYAAEAFHKYIEENGRQSKRRDLLTKILISSDDADTMGIVDTDANTDQIKSQTLTDKATIHEIANLVFAGTDTASTTLTYLFWELAKHQEWQDRLREELESRVPNDTVVPEYSSITDLPILDAIINETLRLHPAAPASLPRSTPAGGRTLDGYFIPEGTVVSTQSYTTHRDPLAFPNPELFDPNRWLNPPPSPSATRAKDLFIPYSKGPRACLGQNMATMELKLTTAALVLAARIKLAAGTTEESMQMMDHFLAVPKGGRCDLRFKKVK